MDLERERKKLYSILRRAGLPQHKPDGTAGLVVEDDMEEGEIVVATSTEDGLLDADQMQRIAAALRSAGYLVEVNGLEGDTQYFSVRPN